MPMLAMISVKQNSDMVLVGISVDKLSPTFVVLEYNKENAHVWHSRFNGDETLESVIFTIWINKIFKKLILVLPCLILISPPHI